MVTPKALTVAELAAGLRELPHWRAVDRRLVASLRIDRATVPALYAAIAAAEDAADHHARVTVSYDRVDVELATHEAGYRITARDLALAATISTIVTTHRES
ncbi:4a-hydroxytetrahydrobiopterin dehydratase [Kitasatospora sp. NPDC094011]|uniref:4a-hydroxytetrahydrobiopterin dehydratase n=1 Tax=Kitasatospora sp. NPDC094011 TaxID=3364090 RepID=UPI00381F9042